MDATCAPASDTVRTTCPYCGVGCGLLTTHGVDGKVDVRGDPSHPANLGRMCSKGAALGETLVLDGRLLHPEIHGIRTSWNTALDVVARGFEQAIAKHGPDSVAFYVSGQLLTEDYYVANKLMKGYIGTANIDTNSRLCMASAVAGYKRAFGSDTVPNEYSDIDNADLVLIAGSNMAWCHPVLFQRLVSAKERNPSLEVIVIDPRRTATCDIADLHLQVLPGTDVALFNGLLNYLRREDALDWEFLEAHTEGFGAAIQAAKDTAPSVPAVAAACRVPEADVAAFYRAFTRTPRTVTLFSQGMNQSSSGTDKVNAIVNVHLATGRIGKSGMGPFSLTGQPNAMGGREVGGLANQLAAHMEFDARDTERVRRFWRSPRIADRAGLKAVELFEAIGDGRIKAVWIMSTNPVVSMPDADRVRRALERCELVVVSDCVRATDTTAVAHVLLPAATWGEKSGTVTNSERRISRQRAFLAPPGESRPDWWIVCEVAKRMGYGAGFDYRSPAQIFREHACLSAFENEGSRDFDIGALATLEDADYDELAPVQWPAPADRPRRRLFADGRFFTANGKARLVATVPAVPQTRTSEARPFVLNTGRVRDQWHTMTRTGQCARLSGRDPEPFVQVHPTDAVALGISAGDLVAVSNDHGRLVVRAQITDAVRRGQIFVPMHWNSTFASAARVGSLLAASADPVSGQPELKHGAAALAPYRPAWHAFVLTRASIDVTGCDYVARVRGDGFWRYELAGERAPASWPEWASRLLGPFGDRIEMSDPARGRYRGAWIEASRLQACVFVAADKSLPARGWLSSLFAAPELDHMDRLGVLAGRAVNGATETGPLVCSCFSVGRATLIRAIRTQALVCTDDIGRALGAGTNCGSCLPELRELLAETADRALAAG